MLSVLSRRPAWSRSHRYLDKDQERGGGAIARNAVDATAFSPRWSRSRPLEPTALTTLRFHKNSARGLERTEHERALSRDGRAALVTLKKEPAGVFLQRL